MIDPNRVRLYIPEGLKDFKLKLFNRIGSNVGGIIRANTKELDALQDCYIPAVGCMPEVMDFIIKWRAQGRQYIYWDRGYARRVFATDLPTGENGGFYRWSIGAFQMTEIGNVPDDRWRALKTDVWPWSKEGKHIVIAEPSDTYQRFHRIEGWTKRTIEEIKKYTDRPLVFRNKEMQRFGRKLHEDLRGAHAWFTHGSNAATEAAIMGCPVYVCPDSAAALVGHTDLGKIEEPVYPDRQLWLNSLAYSQWDENELTNGTLWNMLK